MLKKLYTPLRRCAAAALAAALLCTAVLAAEPEAAPAGQAEPAAASEPRKSVSEQRREDLDFLYEKVLLGAHPNAFTAAPESAFLALKQDIEARLETESDTAFLLDLLRLTALAGDAHTMISAGSAAAFRCYPFSLILRDGKWYLSMLPAAERGSLGKRVAAVNGMSMDEVLEAFAPLLPADNPVILARRFRQDCQIADMYEYLGLSEAGAPLTLTLEGGRKLVLAPVPYGELEGAELAYLSDRIAKAPATAQADAWYFAKPLDKTTYYIQYNTCREAEDLPMADFAAQIQSALEAGSYSRVLVDLRNNGGGSDGVIWPVLEVLRQAMDRGCELVGLIGPATFSSALINAVELQEMGGVLAGEAAGGSVSHFGAVQGFSLPNSGVRGQVSGKYIDLNTLLDAGAGRGVIALEPDVSLPQTMADTLAGRDTAVEWLRSHPERLAQRAYPDAPLTRGRFIGLLYEAAGRPAVEAEGLPFADCFGIEWYLPALAWAKETGIARGGLDGAFSAARGITRQEMSVFLRRAGEVIPAWEGLVPEEGGGAPTREQGEALAARAAGLLGRR